MNYQIGFLSVGILALASIGWSAPQSGSRTAKDKQLAGLLDTAKHKQALLKSVVFEPAGDGHLDVLKACADVGILCGIELDKKMAGKLDASYKKRSLYSLIHDALGDDVRCLWIAPQNSWEPDLSMLTLGPKKSNPEMDRIIEWDIGRTGGMAFDAFELSKKTSLISKPVDGGGGLFGSFKNVPPARMAVRDVLNHIAGINSASWQIDFSSKASGGLLTYFPAQPKGNH